MRVFTPISTHLMWLVIFFVLSPIASAVTPAQLAAESEYQDAKISPDGKHIALVISKDGRRKLAVVKSSNFKAVGGADFGDKEEVGEIYWANNERIVIEVLINEPWDDRARFYGELYAIDYNGKRGVMLYGHRAGERSIGTKMPKRGGIVGHAEIISLLPNEEDQILISSRPQSANGGRTATVHRLNVKSGKMSNMVAGSPMSYGKFMADNSGSVKIAYGIDKDYHRRVYRFDEDKREYTEVDTGDFGGGWQPRAVDNSGEYLVYTDDNQQDKEGLFKLNLDTGERSHIFTDKKVDITDVSVTVDGSQAYAIRLDTDYPSYVMIDESGEEAKLFKYLLSRFAGHVIDITSRSDNGKKWIIKASNDTTASGFFLYDTKKDKFSLLFSNMAKIKKQELSESIPIHFTASDKTEIYGYITYPVSVPETQSIPLVTLVHGGPHLRDYWNFDPQVQLLASQGYAVLRVNFRGSSGYGSKIYYGSQKQWGDRVQKDIIEGTKWVMAQGGILSDKVCIMGASFGGYSAVSSATLAPDLFKCAVALAGVYDIEMMFEEGDIKGRLWGKAALTEEHGSDTALMHQHSPVNNVDKLKAPLLIAHGGQDERVPIEHAEKLMAELDKQGKPYEKFIKEYENHGFYNEQNRIEYYEKVVEFLGKHLK
jgi:dipeptidyl aminopeptidase/acylaminoacyl peptidase